jgi:heat shock protein HslJ
MPRSLKYSSLLVVAAWCLACSRDGEPNKAAASPPSASGDLAPSDTTPPRNLAGTRWRLLEIQSPKNPKGPVRPEDPNKYMMSFDSEGGIIVLRLDCNRARGTYSDTRNADRRGGGLTISSLGVTRAQCAQPSLGDRIVRDLGSVRSYRVASGKLFLEGLPDGSTHVWQRTELPQ